MKKGLIGLAAVAAMLIAFTGFAPGAAAEGKGSNKSANSGSSSQERGAAAPSDDDDSKPEQGTEENAHPSGKDRHEDKGTQGRSTSDPDSDGKGMDRDSGCSAGQDKPYTATTDGKDGGGGCDLADQDGNNGCGNDDDFEDDNNGWCGKPKSTGRTTTGGTTTGGTTTGGNTSGTTTVGADTNVGGTTIDQPRLAGPLPTSVLGVTLERTAPTAGRIAEVGSLTSARPDQAAAPIQAQRPTEVLGVTLSRGGGTLARTGLTVGVMALLGLGMVVAGGGLRRFGRRTEA